MLRRMNAVFLTLVVVLSVGLLQVTVRKALASGATFEGPCPNIIGTANCDSTSTGSYIAATFPTCNRRHIDFWDILTLSHVDYYECCQYKANVVMCFYPSTTPGASGSVSHLVEYFRFDNGRSDCSTSGNCGLAY